MNFATHAILTYALLRRSRWSGAPSPTGRITNAMPRNNPDKRYLTPGEVAEALLVSPATVRQWAASGRLPAELTPGGHRRFLREEVEAFAERRRGEGESSEREKANTETKRVLIVDDDQPLCRYLAVLLTALDGELETETAFDGFEAGLKVASFRPHLLLLDLYMPGMDGFEVCRRIKENPETRAIEVVAISSQLSEENRRRILAAGASRCLAKPLDETTLRSLLAPAP